MMLDIQVERTAIRAAVEKGNMDIVRCLLQAFPEARDMEDEVNLVRIESDGASAVDEFERASQEKVYIYS